MVCVPLSGRVKLRDVAELRITLLEHDVDGQGAKRRKVILKLFSDHDHGGGGIVLSASAGFAQHVIDASQELDVSCGVFESSGGLLFFAGVLPHNGGAALR